ncbi:SGNH/GDSL hydrolase family protein [Yeosuana sp. AK3]
MVKQISFIIVILIGLALNAQVVNSKDKLNNQQILSNTVELSLPDEMFILEGNRLEIFKHSIINAINPDNYFLNVKVIDGIAKGEFYDRVFVYDCKNGDKDMTLEFTLANEEGVIISKKTTTIKTVKKAISPKHQFNILLIGDSFTATATYPEELMRRLIDSIGNPMGYGLKNINFIGNTPKATKVNREGHSGKSWAFFTGNESPFYNDRSGQIDFSKYVSKYDYSSIDAVVIILGTNSISSNETVSGFLDKLIEFNPKIKGIVTGKILATPYGGGGGIGVKNEQTFYGSFKNTFLYNRRMENLIKSKYSLNFTFVDLLPSFDIMHNMQFKLVVANFRNQNEIVKQASDNVHPAKSGYLQIADTIYNALNSIL